LNLARLFEPDEARDALRKLAGLLVGLGLFMVFARKSTIGEPWGAWGLLVVLLLATGFLYGVGLLGRLNTPVLRAWQAVYLVFGLILVPFTLFQFIDAIGGTPGTSLNVFWVFLVTAGLGAVVALLANVRYGLLLASIAVIVSWSAVWNKILSDGLGAHYGIYRGLLIVLAIGLLAAAYALYSTDVAGRFGLRREPAGQQPGLEPEASRWGLAHEVVTGAAIAAVAAGSISFTKLFAGASPFFSPPTASPNVLWDIVLLVVSLAAVAYGARFAVRGPAYVGAIGLLVFMIVVGFDIADPSPGGKIVGWPLILVLVGAAAFLASLLPDLNTSSIQARLRRGGPGAGGPSAGPPAGGGTAGGGASPP
jgi:hypothetical protein